MRIERALLAIALTTGAAAASPYDGLFEKGASWRYTGSSSTWWSADGPEDTHTVKAALDVKCTVTSVDTVDNAEVATIDCGQPLALDGYWVRTADKLWRVPRTKKGRVSDVKRAMRTFRFDNAVPVWPRDDQPTVRDDETYCLTVPDEIGTTAWCWKDRALVSLDHVDHHRGLGMWKLDAHLDRVK